MKDDLSKEEQKQPPETGLDYLIRTKKFGEAIMLSWSLVESSIAMAFLKAFGLIDQLHPVTISNGKVIDPRIRFLLKRISFDEVLQFLRGEDMKKISDKQITAITKFQKRRNDMFHSSYFNFELLDLTDAEKEERIRGAREAVEASGEVAFGDYVLPKG